ncbi:MAG: AAA family ATPase [Dehalococcoidia bacterium]|nr:AAA family ATPase [Dehalococcoidia bacterium]
MAIKIIGVVGRIGSGKDEVLKYLRSKYGIPYLSTGDMVRAIALKEGLALTRENLEIISERCFIKMGKGCFVKMAAEDILKKDWKVAGISGIRAPADVEILRELFGTAFILLRVDIADTKVRFQRIAKRHEERDPSDFDEFLVQDRSEEEVFHISKTLAMSQHSLKNDGTIEELHRQVNNLVKTKKLLAA